MKITATKNGPYQLTTDENLVLNTDAGEKALKSPCYLCRCGQSKNKPLCDGSHMAAKFEAPASEIAGGKKT